MSFCPGAAKGPTACRTLGGFAGAGAAVVAVGDVTGDHFPDIVAGVPGRGAAGALLMWRGGRRGPAGAPAEITQQSPGIRGHDQAGDLFGAALALTDLDRDGFTDLVVGAPGEDEGAGRVTLAFGGPDGLVPEGGRVYSEGERGLPGTKRPGQHFGAALGVLDTNDDGRPELCVAVPAGRGTVVTLPGFDGGFARAGSSAFSLARLRDGRPARDEKLHIGG